MSGKVIQLVTRKRAEQTFAYAIQTEPQSVRIILGDDADGVELGLDPDEADSFATEIHAAAAAARAGRRS